MLKKGPHELSFSAQAWLQSFTQENGNREGEMTALYRIWNLLGSCILKVPKKLKQLLLGMSFPFYKKDAFANRRDLGYFPTLLCALWCLFCFIPQLPYSSFLKSQIEPMTACSKRWVPPRHKLSWLIVSFLDICWSEYMYLLNSEASSRVILKGLYRPGLQYIRHGVGLCPAVPLCKM